MTTQELIEQLEIFGGTADERQIVVMTPDDQSYRVTGVDSYEDALVLVTEPLA